MPKTQISCPRCHTPMTAEIQQLFDMNTDPQAKQKMLSGAANVIQCPACGYQGLYPTPIVYHDPEKEMLLTYFPAELGVSINEQEKMVGPLIKRVVNDLPMEKRKAYLFQAKSMLTYQTMMEKILEGDGVTKEMLDSQQKKLQLIQRLLSTPNEDSRKEIIKQEEALIDETFFGLLSRLVEATMAQGDKQSAQQLALFQQELLQETKVGQEIQEKMKSSQKAMEDLQESAKEGLTREKLLDLFVNAPDEIYTNTLIGLVRTGIDYEFFQILSQKIDSTNDLEQKNKLTNLRDFLVEITRQIDAQIQEEKQSARQTLEKIMAETNIEVGLEKYGNELNDYFVEAVKDGLQEARKAADLDKIAKLGQLNSMIEEASKPPAEIQFVESLLRAPDTEAIKSMLNQNPEVLNDEFIQLLAGLISQTEQQGNQQALVTKLKEIQKIATKYNLIVIYDAAHTFGVTVNGVGIGNFGDISMFSFHATKVFNTIEGGALTYNNSKLQQVLNDIKNFGITGPETIEYVGGNAKMNEFQAAMGLCNLRHVDEEIKKRKVIVDRYYENLDNNDGIILPKTQKGVKSNYAYFPVIFDGFKKDRDQVFIELKENNIIARKYFYPLTNTIECYKDEYNVEDTPVAKHIAERVLTLPLYSNLGIEDVDRICEIIKR